MEILGREWSRWRGRRGSVRVGQKEDESEGKKGEEMKEEMTVSVSLRSRHGDDDDGGGGSFASVSQGPS
ncbi:hypothetical protein KEM55_009196 [Ascosphaera atra]|nr:hypothetical protein KEM55_009196 [Ascosphaera atra]